MRRAVEFDREATRGDMSAMAYVIYQSTQEHPVPYPLYPIRKELASGQEVVMWNNTQRERIQPEWAPQAVLRADYIPERDRPVDNPDISFTSGAPCLSARARDMIESLEPGIHQFFPIDIYDTNGVIREPRRYILNGCQCVDAIVEGKHSIRKDGTRFYYITPRRPVKIRKNVVSKLHLWRDKQAADSRCFISDKLYEKIAAAGYREVAVAVAQEV